MHLEKLRIFKTSEFWLLFVELFLRGLLGIWKFGSGFQWCKFGKKRSLKVMSICSVAIDSRDNWGTERRPRVGVWEMWTFSGQVNKDSVRETRLEGVSKGLEKWRVWDQGSTDSGTASLTLLAGFSGQFSSFLFISTLWVDLNTFYIIKFMTLGFVFSWRMKTP